MMKEKGVLQWRSRQPQLRLNHSPWPRAWQGEQPGAKCCFTTAAQTSSAAAGNAALGSSGGAADVSNAWERPSAAAHPVQATAPLT